MKIIVNSNRGRIEGCPPKLVSQIYKHLSYRSFGYQFSDAYLQGRWDGYVRKFSKATHSFPSGLLHRVSKFLKTKKEKFTVTDQRKIYKIDKDEVFENIDDFGLVLRPYQIDGLIKGIFNPYMIFWWATASGKTVQFSSHVAAFKRDGEFVNSLILVTKKDLAFQHREEMEKMLGEKIGIIEEGRFEPERVTVAVINTLWIKVHKKKDKAVKEYLENIEYLIIDECHHLIDSKMMKQVVTKCKNTIARHGFSGSPYSLTTDDMELECLTGPPLSKVSMSMLIQKGWVSRPIINMVSYPTKMSYTFFRNAYNQQIVNGKIRNKAVTDIVLKKYNNTEKSILILVRIVRHGKLLLDSFLEAGIENEDVEFIYGGTHKSKRNGVKEDFKSGKLRIVIASQIWNEGINIPIVGVLVKADGGGGKHIEEDRGVRSVVQQIGRVLRKPVKKDGEINTSEENIVEVYDFLDRGHKDLWKHSSNREKTFKMEKEYIVKRINYDEI